MHPSMMMGYSRGHHEELGSLISGNEMDFLCGKSSRGRIKGHPRGNRGRKGAQVYVFLPGNLERDFQCSMRHDFNPWRWVWNTNYGLFGQWSSMSRLFPSFGAMRGLCGIAIEVIKGGFLEFWFYMELMPRTRLFKVQGMGHGQLRPERRSSMFKIGSTH